MPPYKRYDILQFSHYDVILDLDTRLARQARDEARPRELFPSQLRTEIARQQALGKNPVLSSYTGISSSLSRLRRLSLLALARLWGRPSQVWAFCGYVLGLGAIFVYYIFLTASDALADKIPFFPLSLPPGSPTSV